MPVTVDPEAGYGLPAAELAGRLAEAGAAGCTIEDTDHARGALRPVGEQADRPAALRVAAGEALVISARIDCFLGGTDPAAVFDEALGRARAYLEAGADCAPGSGQCHRAARRPRPRGYGELGVARVSLGAGLFKAEQAWLQERLATIAAGQLP